MSDLRSAPHSTYPHRPAAHYPPADLDRLLIATLAQPTERGQGPDTSRTVSGPSTRVAVLRIVPAAIAFVVLVAVAHRVPFDYRIPVAVLWTAWMAWAIDPLCGER